MSSKTNQIFAIVLMVCSAPSWAQDAMSGPFISEPEPLTVERAMANARRFTRTETVSDCIAQRETTSDIIVCGGGRDHGLPLNAHDQAVSADLVSDPYAHLVCGDGVSCGGNVLRGIGMGIQLVGLLLDPEASLGDGPRIPRRFRGANR